MLMERYNLLFCWFVGLSIDDAVWDHSVFSKNRDRLLEHGVVEQFCTEVMGLADQCGLLSEERFSVDRTLIQAWASHKSFRNKDGSDEPVHPGGGAMWRLTGRVKRAVMTRISRPLIHTRGGSRRVRRARLSWAMC